MANKKSLEGLNKKKYSKYIDMGINRCKFKNKKLRYMQVSLLRAQHVKKLREFSLNIYEFFTHPLHGMNLQDCEK